MAVNLKSQVPALVSLCFLQLCIILHNFLNVATPIILPDFTTWRAPPPPREEVTNDGTLEQMNDKGQVGGPVDQRRGGRQFRNCHFHLPREK